MYAQVEKWVRQSDADYVPPPKLPFEDAIFESLIKNIDPKMFGVRLRNEYFSLDPEMPVFLAHGSYGAVPKPTLMFYQQLQQYIEHQPVRFFYDDLYPQVIQSLRAVAKLAHCTADRLAFVPNVEFGMAAVLRSLPWKVGAKVLMFDLNYGAVKMSVEQIGGPLGVEVVTVPFPYPVKNADCIVEALERFLSEKGLEFVSSIKLAFFEHVTSPTAIRLPVERLIQVCRQHKIRTMIDGAHALGLFDLNLDQLKPDYYVSNGHKWLSNARGAAILYVAEELKAEIHPVVTSWGSSQGFNAEFIWQGTMDYAAQISMRAAIRFLDFLGGMEIVTKRNREMAHWAAKYLTCAWDTDTLVPLELCDAMVAIRVPASTNADEETCSMEKEPIFVTASRNLNVLGEMQPSSDWKCRLCLEAFPGADMLQKHFVDHHIDVLSKRQLKKTVCGVNTLQATLWKDRRIEVPFFSFKGQLYMRISCHVYNDRSEIEMLASAVCELLSLNLDKNRDALVQIASKHPCNL